MERETKQLDIQGHTFVVKTYATAREAQAIQNAYFKGARVEVLGQSHKITDINPALMMEVEKEMITQLVVSLDADSSDVLNRLLNLDQAVYDELVPALDALTAKKKRSATQ